MNNEDQKKDIFFLKGYAKSGTNWVCNLLNLHHDISCNGEFHFEGLFRVYRDALTSKIGLMPRDPKILRQEWNRFITRLVRRYGDPSKIMCGDRTPGPILEYFLPNKKYIVITRDGRDCCVSWFYHVMRRGIAQRPKMIEKQRLFKEDPQYFENHKNELLDLESLVRGVAKRWNDVILSDLESKERSENGKLNCKIHMISYEQLHSDTEKERKEMYSFLDLDPNNCDPLNDITTPGFKETNVKSHYRKGAKGDWKNYFTDEQLSWFMEEASEGLSVLGLE
jgi:hypothetical protein